METVFSVEFLDKWQTLIGSALGPFLAIILSAVGFLLKNRIQKCGERREALRVVEISLTQVLNDLLFIEDQIEDFTKRVRLIIGDIKKINNNSTFVLNRTNFPAITAIYFNQKLSTMKFKSYYLHNKILFIEKMVRWANDTLFQFRADFENLIAENKEMRTIMSPRQQRDSYSHNLEGFIKMVEDVSTSLKGSNFKSVVQGKVFNLKLIKAQFWTLLKYEKRSFRYFKNKKAFDEYIGNTDSIKRIDNLIEEEVDELMLKAQKRNELEKTIKLLPRPPAAARGGA